MKRVSTLLSFFGLALALGLILGTPAFAQRQLLVDDDGVDCPDAPYFTIQDAVNAARPGDHIRVCAGYYFEQVTITKALQIRGDNGAFLYPVKMTANSTSLTTGAPLAAAILVSGTTNVSIENLTVDTLFNGLTDCSPILLGVYFRNASGSLSHMAIRNLYLFGSGLENCQSGIGIFAQSGNGGTSRVEIVENSIHDYQKGGVTANEHGTNVTIARNEVTGFGTSFGAAPNGIQVGFGAASAVNDNQVINHIYGFCDPKSGCPYISTNILVIDANGARVQRNVSGKSQGGIFIQANNAMVEGNHVFNTDTFDGIDLVGNENTAQNNVISNSGRAGIFIRGDRNRLLNNRINEAQFGILRASGTGTVLNNNRFFNTTVTIMNPSSAEDDSNPNPSQPVEFEKTPLPFR